MDNSKVFPTFYFIPLKLLKERERLAEKYGEESEFNQTLMARYLPDLLKEIRALTNNENVIKDYADTLKPIHITILTNAFPYEEEDVQTINKIFVILKKRYRREVGHRFWAFFQQLPFDTMLIRFLGEIFTFEKEEFLNLKPKIRSSYTNIFSLTEEVIPFIAEAIGAEKRNIDDLCSEWQIKKDSPLYEQVWISLLKRFIGDPAFISREDIEVIEKRLSNLAIKDYKEVLSVYLSSFKVNDYHDNFVYQSVRRLKDPRRDDSQWTNLDNHVVRKVKEWLNEKELFEFFESERFDYWKKYSSQIRNTLINKEPKIAAMYFDDFVALEFAELGNAAYFYKKEGFNKFIAPLIKSNVSESLLKEKNAPYFIHKLDHRSYWHSRFDFYMNQFLNGYFTINNRR